MMNLSSRLKELRDLKNRIVLITGASSGIGQAAAFEVARRGAIVVLVARNELKLNQVAQQCMLYSGRPAFAFALDVANPAAIDKTLSQVRHEVGAVDVVINAAGFGDMEPAVDTDPEITGRMFRVNVLGLIYITRQLASDMIDKHYGAIINIASVAAKIPTPKAAVYTATKTAVVGYSDVLRQELRPFGIQVTTVNPGPVATNFFNIADQDGDYLSKVANFTVTPQLVAERLVDTIGYHVREITVPRYFAAASVAYHLFPTVGDFVIEQLFKPHAPKRMQLSAASDEPSTDTETDPTEAPE
ncbi:SDR family NAD(P)-dependent oxidoreductase [Furfurilactobacillus milii]|uniref:SDR family NAD(P)-dependent oxidoreductase n=1 Tax=Furfurilactobacillus milii TaxID=2888272 RepID=A0A6N9I193_9LACO|nr:SDR family NAD(P)-dependent oxidoreductase [Furfurilactobacillus milii]MYV16547.1 SDR family NAD(P)-dependent oxidoreductase [Furfurilactobacillus milii]